MTQARARYDEYADWYERSIGDAPPCSRRTPIFYPTWLVTGCLTLACGQGRMSRHLAGLGPDVTGIDMSAAMLGKARATGPADISYIHGDVIQHVAWWDGRPFDGCTCEMALMDIEDLAGTLSAVAAVLRPGGWFVASIVHPCFPGYQNSRSSWPSAQGYESEGWWISPDHNPTGSNPGRCDTPQAVYPTRTPCLTLGWTLSASSSRQPQFRPTCCGDAAGGPARVNAGDRAAASSSADLGTEPDVVLTLISSCGVGIFAQCGMWKYSHVRRCGDFLT